MKYFSFLLLFCANPFISFTQNISDIRQLPVGTEVTASGIVTNGSELGEIRYFQDQTAGLAAYPGNGSVPGFDAVKAGDSIRVTGTLVDFNGLLEISPITAFEVLSSGNVVTPLPLSSLAEATEDLEGRLVTLPCIRFRDPGAAFSGSGTYDVFDSDAVESRIYLRGGHPLIGSAIPDGPVQLTTIVSQFFQVQLLPRGAADLQAAPCFYFTRLPDLNDFQKNSLEVSWNSNLTSPSILFYGDTPQMSNVKDLQTSTTNHQMSLDNLTPGTIYYTQAVAIHNNDTIRSPVRTFATESNSSGQIKVLFNFPIDENIAAPYEPDGTSLDECLQEIYNRIDSACCTIDVALYNNDRPDIVDRLNAAHQRGVRVRYIAAEATANEALETPPDFPLVYGNAFDLMHNKFMVCDAGSTENAWVLTGSLNWTSPNMAAYNNLVVVQDESLAKAYTLEMDEMWGGTDALPDTIEARFGANKTDNTPHFFRIGGAPVECRFSPSDGTTQRMREALASSETSLFFALLTFTRDELAEQIVMQNQSGVNVAGLIDNTNDQGSEFMYLRDNGILVLDHEPSKILHHKYAVVDADDANADPLVITGSHNWSNAAEEFNDENTLIIRDERVARLFWAEFRQRFDEFTVSTEEATKRMEWSVTPNPACDRLQVMPADKTMEFSRYEIMDLTGKLKSSGMPSQWPLLLDLSSFAPGTYLIRFSSSNGHISLPFQKVCR